MPPTRPSHPARRRRRQRAALVACVLVLALAGQAQAAPGDLDGSFSFDGRQTTDFGGPDDDGASVAVQADGKIVVAGSTDQGAATGLDFAVARYNPDGTLDGSFSGDGRQTTGFGAGTDRGEGVAIQADGKIVVSGSSEEGVGTDRHDFALARYNPDGTLDGSFSGDGRQTTDFGGTEAARAVAIQADGKIVAAGIAGGFALARYNADGTLDGSFSDDGRQTTDFGGGDEFSASGQAVAVQADGKIVVAGHAPGVLDPRFGRLPVAAIARYGPDGTLDSSFSGDGLEVTWLGAYGSFEGMAIQADGKIVAAGNAGGLVLARYIPDGTLDSSFAEDGIQTTDFATGSEGIEGVALKADGKIVVAGRDGDDFALARYDPDGTLDSSFSGDGRQTTDFGGTSGGRAVAIQGDGRIVVAGYSDQGAPGRDFALARYQGLPDGPSTPPPGGSAPPPPAGGRTITGTAGNDALVGTPGNDVINCGAGDDVVTAGAGNDIINCGAGNDTIDAGAGDDRVDGGSGNDRVLGRTGRDVIAGSAGNDRIFGNEGNDRITGGSGRDRLAGNSGNDRVGGGSGRDVIGGGSGNDRLSGNSGADRISGDSGSDRVSGGSGADRLFGGAGRDRLRGGSGSDRLAGGPGRDRLIGGPGRDGARQ